MTMSFPNLPRSLRILGLLALLAALAVMASAAEPQASPKAEAKAPAPAASAPGHEGEPTAEQKFKNIKVLPVSLRLSRRTVPMDVGSRVLPIRAARAPRSSERSEGCRFRGL